MAALGWPFFIVRHKIKIILFFVALSIQYVNFFYIENIILKNEGKTK